MIELKVHYQIERNRLRRLGRRPSTFLAVGGATSLDRVFIENPYELDTSISDADAATAINAALRRYAIPVVASQCSVTIAGPSRVLLAPDSNNTIYGYCRNLPNGTVFGLNLIRSEHLPLSCRTNINPVHIALYGQRLQSSSKDSIQLDNVDIPVTDEILTLLHALGPMPNNASGLSDDRILSWVRQIWVEPGHYTLSGALERVRAVVTRDTRSYKGFSDSWETILGRLSNLIAESKLRSRDVGNFRLWFHTRPIALLDIDRSTTAVIETDDGWPQAFLPHDGYQEMLGPVLSGFLNETLNAQDLLDLNRPTNPVYRRNLANLRLRRSEVTGTEGLVIDYLGTSLIDTSEVGNMMPNAQFSESLRFGTSHYESDAGRLYTGPHRPNLSGLQDKIAAFLDCNGALHTVVNDNHPWTHIIKPPGAGYTTSDKYLLPVWEWMGLSAFKAAGIRTSTFAIAVVGSDDEQENHNVLAASMDFGIRLLGELTIGDQVANRVPAPIPERQTLKNMTVTNLMDPEIEPEDWLLADLDESSVETAAFTGGLQATDSAPKFAPYFVSERFDITVKEHSHIQRIALDGTQLLKLPASAKYKATWTSIAERLKEVMPEASWQHERFEVFRQIAGSYLICDSDNHVKNFSLLVEEDVQTGTTTMSISPAYDRVCLGATEYLDGLACAIYADQKAPELRDLQLWASSTLGISAEESKTILEMMADKMYRAVIDCSYHHIKAIQHALPGDIQARIEENINAIEERLTYIGLPYPREYRMEFSRPSFDEALYHHRSDM